MRRQASLPFFDVLMVGWVGGCTWLQVPSLHQAFAARRADLMADYHTELASGRTVIGRAISKREAKVRDRPVAGTDWAAGRGGRQYERQEKRMGEQ